MWSSSYIKKLICGGLCYEMSFPLPHPRNVIVLNIVDFTGESQRLNGSIFYMVFLVSYFPVSSLFNLLTFVFIISSLAIVIQNRVYLCRLAFIFRKKLICGGCVRVILGWRIFFLLGLFSLAPSPYLNVFGSIIC